MLPHSQYHSSAINIDPYEPPQAAGTYEDLSLVSPINMRVYTLT